MTTGTGTAAQCITRETETRFITPTSSAVLPQGTPQHELSRRRIGSAQGWHGGSKWCREVRVRARRCRRIEASTGGASRHQGGQGQYGLAVDATSRRLWASEATARRSPPSGVLPGNLGDAAATCARVRGVVMSYFCAAGRRARTSARAAGPAGTFTVKVHRVSRTVSYSNSTVVVVFPRSACCEGAPGKARPAAPLLGGSESQNTSSANICHSAGEEITRGSVAHDVQVWTTLLLVSQKTRS